MPSGHCSLLYGYLYSEISTVCSHHTQALEHIAREAILPSLALSICQGVQYMYILYNPSRLQLQDVSLSITSSPPT